MTCLFSLSLVIALASELPVTAQQKDPPKNWYDDYPQKDVVDPRGPEKGAYRVLRGGSWRFFPQNCRAATRFTGQPGYRQDYVGFRVCFSPD